MPTTLLLGLVIFPYSQTFDAYTFLRCVRLFVFDRLPERTSFLLNKLAIFELVFDSESLKKPITQLLCQVIFGYCQNWIPIRF